MVKENTEQLKRIIHEILNVDVMNMSRKRHIVDARKIYANILHERGMSYIGIGRTLKKDHATVIHYIKDSEVLVLMDKSYKRNYERVFAAFERTIEDSDISQYSRFELEEEIERLRAINNELKTRLLEFYQKREK